MLVTYIGAPCSGKTTTAARVFADLKERGLPVEFLSEYARFYIAGKRNLEGDAFTGLDDRDQFAILQEQEKREFVMAADPRSLVVADSCAMSALLYMTEGYLSDSRMEDNCLWFGGKSPLNLAREAAQQYDIIFRCSPVRPGVGYDPNRIHSYEQSLDIDKRIDRILDLCRVDRSKVFPLFGVPKLRVSESHAVIMPRLIQKLVHA